MGDLIVAFLTSLPTPIAITALVIVLWGAFLHLFKQCPASVVLRTPLFYLPSLILLYTLFLSLGIFAYTKIVLVTEALQSLPHFSIGRNNVGHPIIATDYAGNLNLKPAMDDQAIFARDGNTGRGIQLYGGGANTIQSVDQDGSNPFYLVLQPILRTFFE